MTMLAPVATFTVYIAGRESFLLIRFCVSSDDRQFDMLLVGQLGSELISSDI